MDQEEQAVAGQDDALNTQGHPPIRRSIHRQQSQTMIPKAIRAVT
jgi:hypothetical protein